MSNVRFLSLLLVASLVISVLPASVGAQGGRSEVYVHDTRPPEEVTDAAGYRGLAMDVVFSLVDADGQIMGNEPESVNFVLGPEESYQAQEVQQLESPWRVAVIVDASFNVYPSGAAAAFKKARDELIRVVGQLPDDTIYMVYSFNDRATLELEPATGKETVIDKIKRIQAKNTGSACLNEAVYAAVNKLTELSGRRAVLVLTASGNSCSTHATPDEAIELAQTNHIQIYGAGLRGYSITDQEFGFLAGETGGLATVRDGPEMVEAFEHIRNALTRQWRARTTMYPQAGEYPVRIEVILPGNTTLVSRDIPLTVGADYDRPPSISLGGKIVPVQDGLSFRLNIEGSSRLVDHLHVKVTDVTGETRFDNAIPDDVSQNPHKVLITGLVEGQEYAVVITAIDERNRVIGTVQDTFTYQVPKPAVRVTQVDPPTVDRPQVDVFVGGDNLDTVKSYQLWLAPDGSNAAVPDTEITVPANASQPFVIPVPEDLATGVYVVRLVALGDNNTTLASTLDSNSPDQKFSYTQVSWFDRMLSTLAVQPMAIAGVTMVACLAFLVLGAVVWMLLPKRSARPKTVELVLPQIQRRPPPVILDSAPVRTVNQPVAREAQPEPQRRPQPVPSPRESALPAACLVGLEPATLRVSCNLGRSPFTIGRRTGNDLVLPVDNKLGVSGRHATIQFNNGRYFLVDDKSTFGTLLNESRIPPGKPVPLDDGAVIGLGPKVKIRFSLRNCP